MCLAVGVICFHFKNGLALALRLNSDSAEQMKIHSEAFPALEPQAHEDQTDATRTNN